MGPDEMPIKRKTRFLVTGGAGFIGSNLAEHLLKLGFRVRVLDNFHTGSIENIQEFMHNPDFELLEGDLRDVRTCRDACADMDYILHQGALGSVSRSVNDPKMSSDVNITGTLNIMIAARDSKVRRLIYASSSSVYGDSTELPKVEGREGRAISPYAVTKIAGELYGRVFNELYKLECIGLRYFNVFGKKQDPDSCYAAVIPLFIKKLLKNEIPVINGDGNQSRDFTYIDNVVAANLNACMAPVEACGNVFNVACGLSIKLNELFEIICGLLSKNVKPVYGPERAGDVRHSLADISRAASLLGYKPSVHIREGLSRTIEWYRCKSDRQTI